MTEMDDISDPRLNVIRKKFSDNSIAMADNQGIPTINMNEMDTLNFLLFKILERLESLEKRLTSK